jgi:hypothetical protein
VQDGVGREQQEEAHVGKHDITREFRHFDVYRNSTLFPVIAFKTRARPYFASGILLFLAGNVEYVLGMIEDFTLGDIAKPSGSRLDRRGVAPERCVA